MSRYARQIILPEVGVTGQERLRQSHVLVVGAGGLGCPVLLYLAGAGVGRITLFDPDTVDESNLHRQVLYRMSDLGRPKVLAARDHLLSAHPDLQLMPRALMLDPANAPDAVAAADLVIDAADSFAVSYTLSDICLRNHVPLISASALGQAGYVGGFCGTAPSLRAVFPDPPDNGASCATAGVLGPVVGMIGAAQAQMALQVLLGHDPSPLGQMINIDMQGFQVSSFTFQGAREPERSFPFLSRQELTARDRIFELRDKDEAPEPAHATAIRCENADLARLTPSDRRIVLCCRTGLRAWRAAAQLVQQGNFDIALLAAVDPA